jgi:hypothetical protein
LGNSVSGLGQEFEITLITLSGQYMVTSVETGDKLSASFKK